MLSIVKHKPVFGKHFLNLRDEMNERFTNFLDEFDFDNRSWNPSADIVEDNDKMMLTVELPGVEKNDVQINVQNNILTIEGEKKKQNDIREDDYFRTERYYGRFSRSFTLPVDLDSDNIKADYNNGILAVTLPKSEQAKPRQIEIK